MNRVKSILVCLSTLSLLSLLIASPENAAAQLGRISNAQRPPRGKPFIGNLPMPKEVTRKTLRNAKGRAEVATPQTVDITANTNTAGKVVTNRNPFWGKDEQSIVFDSDRANINGTDKNTDGKFHIYKMRPDGGTLAALTGPLSTPVVGSGSSQSEPAFNGGSSAIVYIDTASDGSVDLRERNLATNVDRSILKSNLKFAFTALNHPEYGFSATGSVGILFAGKRDTDTVFKLWTVDTQTGSVGQITFGASDDRNPTLSPDPNKPVIAFDSNRADGAGNTTKAKRDVWVMGANPNIQAAVQVTNFAPGGVPSENIEPAWSTNKIDQPTGSQQIINGQQLLGFATTRVDTANDGNANAVGTTHDIYWLKVQIGVDPNNASQFTVINPESATNTAFKLSTDDPAHQFDDRRLTWPQFISTYRVAYITNRKGYNGVTKVSVGPTPETDIFTSTLIDLNAPTLVRFDSGTGEIVGVSPRVTSPGSKVTISVKLIDLESGIRDVWVQIKNPNSKYQSSDGVEHKIYLLAGGSLDQSNFVTDNRLEYDMERIFVGADPSDPRVNSYGAPAYIASQSDFFAFSGVSNPPDESWLKLNPKGAPDADGVITFEADWTTPAFGSDYVIDVIAYDNSLNPFTQSGTDRGSNWKIYDNIWGFSTQVFQPSRNILFVSDYAAGQKFFGSRFGISSLINVSQTFWGTESYMTDMDVALLPKTYRSGTTVGQVIDARNTLGVNSYRDFLTDDGTRVDGFPVPATQTYDIWRIMCRGPVPDSVLQQYAPHSESQPPDTINGETTPRSVLVAPRCVIWHAPYTGNLFTGPGTLTDLSTQVQLLNFLSAGGRLAVNGQDVAWALTLGGQTNSQFLSSALRATFVADSAGFTFSNIPSGSFRPTWFIAGPYAMTAAGVYNPISNDPWRTPNKYFGSTHHVWLGPPFPPGDADYISNETEYFTAGSDPTQPHTAQTAGGAGYPDSVTPLAPAISDFTYAGGGTAVQHYADPATGQRVVYMPMGIEGLFTDFYTGTNVVFYKNRRSETMHNTVCWLRTGTFTGTVVNTEGGQPLPNVLVRLSNTVDAQGKPIIKYTALTTAGGTYVVNGVEPDDYEVSAVLPGFSTQKRNFTTTHGGYRTDISFKMTKAEPASIKGKITRTDGTTAIPGAVITATDLTTPTLVYTTVSDANGDYSFDRIPALTRYKLTVTATGYGSSIPDSYIVEDPNDPTKNNLLQPATVYKPYDFKLKAVPGNVTGFVYVNNNGAQGAPIAGATVTATVLGGATVTAITDANGAYSFNVANTPPNGLDPGAASLVATAPGYAPNAPVTVNVITAQTVTAPVILLSPVAPGSLSGLVTRTSDGAPLAGVLIQLKDANGSVVTSTTTVDAQTVNGYKFNYLIASVPAGVTYTVTAQKDGFTAIPATQTAAVTSGAETKNINFQMEPLHTFSASLSMVSAPYDYTNRSENIAELLSVPPGDPAFLLATWDVGRYVYFPTPPADKFRLGRGYFLGYKTNLPLSIQGTPADATRPFDISLAPGWNMIGDPFLFDIDWTKSQIVDGGVVKTYDQAVSSAAIGAALYSYQSGTYVLDFRLTPWRGYWVRAYRAVTLRIDPVNGKIGRAAATHVAAGRAVLRGGDGWTLNVRANVGDVKDEDNHLGVTSRATNGFDGYKSEKPPVFGSRFVYLTFDHKDWGERSGGYGVDLRSASTLTNTWDFSVQTNVANSSASISWPNSSVVGRSTSLTLTDLATGQVRDITNSSSYSWQTGDKPATRQFRIEAARNTTNSALRVTNLTARSTRAAGATNISYNLSNAANVEIRVLGASGTTVRHVSSRATRAAGVNEVTWDQRNEQGSAVPSGAYTVEVKAQSTDGRTTARQIATVIITR